MKRLLTAVFLLCLACAPEPSSPPVESAQPQSRFEGLIEGRFPDHETASRMILSTARRTANDDTRHAVVAMMAAVGGLDGSRAELAAYDTWAATLLYDRFNLVTDPHFPAAPTLTVENDMTGLYRAAMSGGLIRRRESVIYSILHNLHVRHSAEARSRRLTGIGGEVDFNEYLGQNAEAAEALVTEMESRGYEDRYLRIIGGIARASVRYHSRSSDDDVSPLQKSLDEIYEQAVSLSATQPTYGFLVQLKGRLLVAGMERHSMLGPARDPAEPDQWLRDQTLRPFENMSSLVVGTGRSYGENHEAFLRILEEDLRTMPSRK